MIAALPRAATSRCALLAVVALLAAPALARADAPVVDANPASDVTASAVTLSGSVNPNGSAADWQFIYGDNVNFFILGPLLRMPAAKLPAGTTPVNVSARLTDLKPDSTYFFSLSAENEIGSSIFLLIRQFRTLHASPALTPGTAANVTSTSVTLSGSVNPNGALTDATFDFSRDPLFSSPIPVEIIDAGDGRAPVPVTTTVRGLAGGTTYYYRLRATNVEGGRTTGELQAVTLLPAAPPQAAPAPPPPTAPAPPAVPKVGSSGSAAVKQSGKALTVTDGHKVTCATACSVQLVATVPAPKAKPKRKPITIARATLKVAAGKTSALTFKLNAAGAKLLRAKRKLTATVTLKLSYGGPAPLTTTHRVVLRAPKKARANRL